MATASRESHFLQAVELHAEWDMEVERIYAIRHTPLPSQGELIGAVNELSAADSIMVSAAGSLPGDLHKLWRARILRTTTWNMAIVAWGMRSPVAWESRWQHQTGTCM